MAGDGAILKETIIISKSANVTVANDNTANNDADLLFAIAANEKVLVRCDCYWTANAAGGFLLGINGPAASTNLVGTIILEDNVAANAVAVFTGYPAANAIVGGTAGRGVLTSTIENGANPGTVNITWSQHTADANVTTLFRGSSLVVQRF